jgi:exosortase/archaeosortase family protein
MTGSVSRAVSDSVRLPRLLAFAGCCIIAALNARSAPMLATVDALGFQNAFFDLFEVSAVVWFALYGAWTIAVSEEGPAAYRTGDTFVLAALIVAILIPLPLLSIAAGFATGLWLIMTSERGSAGWRMALIITAVAAQQIFGRLFLAVFSETILTADVILTGLITGFESHSNVLRRPDGSDVIIGASCSSVVNMSYALLAWVTVAQLFNMRLDKRLFKYVAGSLFAIFLINSSRLLLVAWYPQYFDYFHGGEGAALFAWGGFIILAILAGIAVIRMAPNRQMA